MRENLTLPPGAYPEPAALKGVASETAQKGVRDYLGQRSGGESGHIAYHIPGNRRPRSGVDLHARGERDRAVEVPDRRGGESCQRLAEAAPQAGAGVARHVACGRIPLDL